MTYVHVHACQGWRVTYMYEVTKLFCCKHNIRTFQEPTVQMHVLMHVHMYMYVLMHVHVHTYVCTYACTCPHVDNWLVGGSPIALVSAIITTEHYAKLTNNLTRVTLKVQSRYA